MDHYTTVLSTRNSQLRPLTGPLLYPASLWDHRFIFVQRLSHEPQPRRGLALPSGPASSLERQPSFVTISSPPPLLLFPNLSGIELIKFRLRNRPTLLFHKNQFPSIALFFPGGGVLFILLWSTFLLFAFGRGLRPPDVSDSSGPKTLAPPWVEEEAAELRQPALLWQQKWLFPSRAALISTH